MADSLKDDARKAGKHPRIRPWLLAGAELPATFGAHQAWGSNAGAAVGLTVAAGVVTAATWWAGQGASQPRRIHATLSAGVASTYLVLGTFTDPLSKGMLSTLVIGGATVAVTWNARQVLRINPDTKTVEKGSAETGILTKAIGNAKVALRGAPKIEPNKVTAQLQLAKGEVTTAELGNRITHIASELGVSPTSIRIVPDPDRADQAMLIVVPQDKLVDGTPWPGPSALGGSITEPILFGLYEDGEDLQLWFPADRDRNATHFLFAGMNGSGKSAGASEVVLEVLTRRDVIVWAIDPAKGLQTFGPFLPYLDWVELTMTGGEALIAALSHVITARASEMGRHGFKNWTPEVFEKLGMPYIVVWIEEAARFFRNGTEMEGLVMEARSAGISVILSLQRPSATSMPTDVREQLGGALVFGVKGATTAAMALPDDVIDAGARPEAWENRKRGYCYLVAPGVEEDRYAMKARTFIPPGDDEIEGTLAISPRPQSDSITSGAAGEDYARRKIYTAGADLTCTDTISEAAMDDNEQAINASVDRDLADPDDDTSPTPDVDPDREIPPPAATWAFGNGGPAPDEVTTEQALFAVMALLDEFRSAGLQVVGPKDFMPHLNTAGRMGRIGRSRSWLSPVLAELADRGVHLRDTGRPGEYHLLHPQLAGV